MLPPLFGEVLLPVRLAFHVAFPSVDMRRPFDRVARGRPHHGIYLEAVKIRNRWMTSPEAWRRMLRLGIYSMVRGREAARLAAVQ